MGIFSRVSNFLKPNPEYMVGINGDFEINQKRLAFLVGLIAICLPIILISSSLFGVEKRDTLSSYFFVPFYSGVFAISIAFIGTFLIAYRGKNVFENRFATFAGICAFGIALFPTANHGIEQFSDKIRIYTRVKETKAQVVDGKIEQILIFEPTPLDEAFKLNIFSDNAHILTTIVFFIFLAFYTLFIFTRSVEGVSRIEGKLTREKKIRNIIYYTCGSTMIVSMLILSQEKVPEFICASWKECDLTRKFETLVLICFGIAWMVKSRVFGIILKDKAEY